MSFSYRKFDGENKDNKQEVLMKLYNKKNEQFNKTSVNMIKILQQDEQLLKNSKQLRKQQQKKSSRSQQLYTPVLSPFLKQIDDQSFPMIKQTHDVLLIQDDTILNQIQGSAQNQNADDNVNNFYKQKYSSQPSLSNNVFNFNLAVRKSSLLSDTHAQVLNGHKKNNDNLSLGGFGSPTKNKCPSIHYQSKTEDHGYQLQNIGSSHSGVQAQGKNQTINLLNVEYKIKDDDSETAHKFSHNNLSSTMNNFKTKLNSIEKHNSRNISYMNERVKSEKFQISLNDELCKLLEENNKIIQQKKQQAIAHLEQNNQNDAKSSYQHQTSQSFGNENILLKQISGFRSARITDLVDQFPDSTFISNIQQFKMNKLEKSGELIQQSSLHNKMQMIQQEIQTFLSTEDDNHTLKNSFMFTLAKSLRKANPNFFKDTPSGRSEVLALRKWLEDTLSEILKEQDITNKERIQHADDAMILAINELVRQVSFHCIERGELILQLFSSYFTLVQKFWVHEQDEKEKLKIDSVVKQTTMEQKSKENMEQKEKELDTLRNILTQQTKIEEDYKKKIWEMEISYKELANLHQNSKAHNKLLKKALIKITKENDYLRDRNKNKEAVLSVKQKNIQDKIQEQLSAQKVENTPRTVPQLQLPESKFNQHKSQIIKSNAQDNRNKYNSDQKSKKAIEDNEEQKYQYSFDNEDDDKDTASQISISELINKQDKDFEAQNNMVIMKEFQEDTIKYKLNVEVQTDYSFFTKSEKIQTDLNLIDRKYNIIFENGKVDKIQEDETMKQELFATEEKETMIEELYIPPEGKKERQTMKKILQGHPIFTQLKEKKKTQLELFFDNIHILKQMMEEKNKQDQSLPDKKKQQEEEIKKQKTKYGLNDLPDDPPSPTLGSESQRQKNGGNQLFVPGQNSLNNQIGQQRPPSSRPTSSINQKQNKKSGPQNDLSTFANVKKNQKSTEQKSKEDHSQQSQEKKRISINCLQDTPQDLNNSNHGVEIIQNLQISTVQINNDLVKNYISSLITMYNLECERTKNLKESAEELMKIIKEWFTFSARLLHHIYKTQKNTHISVVESYTQQLTGLRWKLPLELDADLEKVLAQNQESNQNDGNNGGQQKKQIKFFNNHRKTKHSLQNLHKILAIKMTLNDKMQHSGIILLEKVKDSSKIKKANYLPMKNVLKIITQLYEERLRMVREQRLADDQEMSIFAFNKFINMFGFKNVAEKKFLQFLMSVKNYLQIIRINIFARLIGLMVDEKSNYSVEVMTKYFQAYEYIQNVATSGVQCYNNDQDIKFYVPYYRVLEYFKNYLEEKMSQEECTELRLYVENQKEPDKHNVLNSYMVDFDILMEKVLSKYKLILNRTKTFVRHAFFAADLDGNGKINLNEFMTLYRHIEKDKFIFKSALKMFEENADIITEDEKNLSFDKFTCLCVDFQMFSERQQDIFIGLASDQSVPDKFQELRGKWPKEKDDLHYQLRELKEYVVDEDYKNWKQILEILEKRILQDSVQEETMKPIMIAHKLLRSEIDRIIEEGQKVGEEIKSDEDDDSAQETTRQNNDSIQINSQASPPNQKQPFANFLNSQPSNNSGINLQVSPKNLNQQIQKLPANQKLVTNTLNK